MTKFKMAETLNGIFRRGDMFSVAEFVLEREEAIRKEERIKTAERVLKA